MGFEITLALAALLALAGAAAELFIRRVNQRANQPERRGRCSLCLVFPSARSHRGLDTSICRGCWRHVLGHPLGLLEPWSEEEE